MVLIFFSFRSFETKLLKAPSFADSRDDILLALKTINFFFRFRIRLNSIFVARIRKCVENLETVTESELNYGHKSDHGTEFCFPP